MTEVSDSKSLLKPKSEEQSAIVQNIKKGYNVKVDSVAGSGKTTTILHIAKELANKKILGLTYSSKLKLESRYRVEELGIKNLEIHSFHSKGVKYYNGLCVTDHGIIDLIKNDSKRKKIFYYDLMIVDEIQDMTPVLYEFFCKIYKDNNNKTLQICVLGDKKQSIFEFNKADARFITMIDKIFPNNERKWIDNKLSYNFRSTRQINTFINKCCLNEDRLNSVREGQKPRYLVCNTFRSDVLYEELLYYMNFYSCNEIFVLGPSVRSPNSPIRLLANKCTLEGIDIFVPNNDDEKIDGDIIKNKLVFSTFHQVKGLERAVVLIFGFDRTYFKYYKKHADENECPNELYVALTRAKEKMSILHHYENEYVPFLNIECLKEYSIFIEKNRLTVSKQPSNSSCNVKLEEMTRHLPSTVINDCMNNIFKQKINHKLSFKKRKYIDIPMKVPQHNGKYELVSEITGKAIPAYYELLTQGNMTIYNRLILDDKLKKNTDNKVTHNLDDKITTLDAKSITKEELTKIANKYCALLSGYDYKVKQIDNYSWITLKNLEICISRLKSVIDANSKYEMDVRIFNTEYKKVITGYLDCYNYDFTFNNSVVNYYSNSIWQFKCVDKLTAEHFIQISLRAYMFEMSLTTDGINSRKNELKEKRNEIMKKKNYKNNIMELIKIDKELHYLNGRRYYVFNILRNEIYEIYMDLSNLKKMYDLLCFSKFNTNKTMLSDDDFITKMKNIGNKYKIVDDLNKTLTV
jgi:nucleoside-triphosphatase THEP1